MAGLTGGVTAAGSVAAGVRSEEGVVGMVVAASVAAEVSVGVGVSERVEDAASEGVSVLAALLLFSTCC